MFSKTRGKYLFREKTEVRVPRATAAAATAAAAAATATAEAATA